MVRQEITNGRFFRNYWIRSGFKLWEEVGNFCFPWDMVFYEKTKCCGGHGFGEGVDAVQPVIV